MPRVRVAEILHALGKPAQKSGAERVFRCPMPSCSGHDKATLYVNVKKQTFFCQRCEVGRGSKLGGIWKALGIDRPDVGGGDHADDHDRPAKPKKRPKRVPADHAACLHPLGSQRADASRDALAATAWAYLLDQRGLSEKVVRRAGLCAGKDAWAGYILFPVWDGLARKELVYFSGRAFAPAAFPPQRNPPGGVFPIDAGEAVYGIDRAAALGWGVLCEAPLDALKVNEFAMATYGKGVTGAQRDAIRGLGLRKLVIYFDAEEAAQKAAWDLALEIAPSFRDGVWIAVPPGKDPGACTYEENRDAVARATRVTTRSHAEFSLTKSLRTA